MRGRFCRARTGCGRGGMRCIELGSERERNENDQQNQQMRAWKPSSGLTALSSGGLSGLPGFGTQRADAGTTGGISNKPMSRPQGDTGVHGRPGSAGSAQVHQCSPVTVQPGHPQHHSMQDQLMNMGMPVQDHFTLQDMQSRRGNPMAPPIPVEPVYLT